MARAAVSYIDLSVLDEVRPHVVSARAAIVFSTDMEHVLWANSEGSGLLGVPASGGPVTNVSAAQASTLRQIVMAVEQLEHSDTASAAMRIRSGFKTKLLAFTVSELEISGVGKTFLLVSDSLHGRSHKLESSAAAISSALGKDSRGAAVFDGDGNVLGSSDNFDKLKVSRDILTELAAEVADEDDLLVKRPIDTQAGSLPSGVAHLSSRPPLNLIVLADPSSSIEKATSKKTSSSSKKAAPKKPKPVETDEAPVSTVGAFSSKRIKPGEAGLGRWYYKQQAPAADATEDEVQDTADEPAKAKSNKKKKAKGSKSAKAKSSPKKESNDTANVEVEKPARVVRKISSKRPPLPTSKPKSKPKADTSKKASGGLIQTTEHTPVKSAISESKKSAKLDFSETDTAGFEDDGFRFSSSAKPVRFVWEMDADTLFTSVSDEFAAAVGPKTANIEGLNWREVCTLFDLTEADEIAAVLEQGDTWSGKTVLWPVQGTDLRVPIDLAGLPSYGRNRGFDGFNGFGIVRTADAVIDPSATGTKFGPSLSYEAPKAASKEAEQKDAELTKEPKAGQAVSDKKLSADEREAFDEIGEKLGDSKPKKVKFRTVDNKQKSDAPAEKTVPVTAKRAESSVKKVSSSSEKRAKPTAKSTEPADKAIVPSAFVSKKVRIPAHDVDTSILSRLPIPVLVYRDMDLLFANKEFSKLTGYEDLLALAKAGGVDALFGSSLGDEIDAGTSIFHQDGSTLDVQANIQRVPWDEERAMLLTLRRQDPDDRKNKPAPPQGDDDGQTLRTTKSENHEPAPTSSADAPRSFDTPRARLVADNVTPLRSSNKFGTGTFGGLNNEELRNILDTASDGVVVVGTDGTVRALNRSAEALFDTNAQTIIDHRFSKLFAPESHRIVEDYLSTSSGNGVASLLNDGREVIGLTAQGGMIPLSMTLGQLNDQTALCAIFRDMTHWKKVEGELIAAKQEAESLSGKKSDFLAKVSHEVRTPLNAIIGFSDIMIEERFGEIENERYRGYLKDISRSGNHVLELINDLLDISKIEAGEIDLDFDECDLNVIVSETVALSQPQANKQRIIIRTSLSTMVPKVVADPRSLRQIILNLVTNGIKFTKSGGQVIVSTVYDDDGAVTLRVRDTGVGMSREDIETALKPFTQLNTIPETNSVGSGLGLPLTKALVEANRADFHIESTPDEGTMVEMHFPSQRVLADR